ncbi:hypothetical protein Q8A64_02275 [Oxalobacteraceae bacterium R-40]|uniref:Uncharacterized protein n=1 Tax=Keguizhuia sedimenti TaxID=3064264 RepID=A0ABU1BJP5_9BURK|nr:hypothetical protein [Oxalobacteraceae bacterium R-40]
MTNDPLRVYFEALERLKRGQPNIVPRGTKITNDAVSLEAGRKKGSIKKSREQFADLIAAISAAAADQVRPQMEQAEKMSKARQAAGNLRGQLDAALERELSLLVELYEMKKKLAKLTGENVLPIRSARR